MHVIHVLKYILPNNYGIIFIIHCHKTKTFPVNFTHVYYMFFFFLFFTFVFRNIVYSNSGNLFLEVIKMTSGIINTDERTIQLWFCFTEVFQVYFAQVPQSCLIEIL